jgi:hypothetical protein
MDTTFSECVDALKDLRRSVHSDTDPSVGVALDAVISKFESYNERTDVDDADVRKAFGEGIMIISSIVNCCIGVADLIGRFWLLDTTDYLLQSMLMRRKQWTSVKRYDCAEPKKVGRRLN